jgi:hypothetical protein
MPTSASRSESITCWKSGTTYVVAFPNFGEALRGLLESAQIPPPVIADRDLGEHDQEITQLGHRDVGAEALDNADLLQPLDACEAGTGAQPDRVGKLYIGTTPHQLKVRQDLEIHSIEIKLRAHIPPTACSARSRFAQRLIDALNHQRNLLTRKNERRADLQHIMPLRARAEKDALVT